MGREWLSNLRLETNAGRLAENIGLFDLELDDAGMQTMASLDRGLRYNDPQVRSLFCI